MAINFTTEQPTMSEPVIRLDRSKPYPSVHGERSPNDPHYRVHFMQDGLPFDSQGILVPDDGRTENQVVEVDEDDGTTRKVVYRPLYTKDMRATLAKRMQRLAAKASKPAEPSPEHGDDDAPNPNQTDDVNLESWLRGEATYTAVEIFGAYKKRFAKISHRLRDVAEDLILDVGLVPEDQVADHIMKMINPEEAAA